jgi:hypothetical protein
MKKYYRQNFKNRFYKESVISSLDGSHVLLQDKLIEIYKVKQNFPYIFCMQEIVKTKQIRRTGLDEAIRSVGEMNDKINIRKKFI